MCSISTPETAALPAPEHLPTDALHQQLLAARRRHRQSEYELCVLLCELADRRAYTQFQSVNIREYARKHLDLGERRCAELLTLGRRLRSLPELTEVFASGELGWTKAREVARVATPLTCEEWVRRAVGLNSRALEREVAQCKPGDPPPDYDECQPLKPERVRLRFDMRSTDALVLRRAMGVLRAQLSDPDADDGVLLAQMARRVLADEEGSLAEAPAEAQAEARTPQPSVERVRIVIEECPTCARYTHVGHGDDGGPADHAVSEAAYEQACCDHERMEASGPRAGFVSRAVPPAMRRRVLHRARYPCEVVGCGCKIFLDVHHLRRRVEGGDHDFLNLALVCDGHHRAVHEDRLRLWRDPQGTLQAEWLGTSPPPPWTDDAFSALLDVLEWEEMTTQEAASFLRTSPAEARRWLERAERSCDGVRTIGDRWCRHGVLAAALGEAPQALT